MSHLPSVCEALRCILSTAQREKEGRDAGREERGKGNREGKKR